MKEATGILTDEDLKEAIPREEHLREGIAVIIECMDGMVCDACKETCSAGAIAKSLDEPPLLDFAKCNGCLDCMGICPGLAIFAADLSSTGDNGLLTVPYELLPLPLNGERVVMLNRAGKELGLGEVVKVRSVNGTKLVTISCEKRIVLEARNFRREQSD